MLLHMSTQRLSGTVKWFNTQKGFGFIKPDGQDKDVFVHITALQAAGLSHLNDNQRVTFEMIQDRMGKQSAGKLELA